MNSKIVAFPYTPPANASFAKLCLSLQPGENIRVIRCIESWAIILTIDKLGIFPIVFTRNEKQQSKLLMRTARCEPVITLLLQAEENIAVDEVENSNNSEINNNNNNIKNEDVECNVPHFVKSKSSEATIVSSCTSSTRSTRSSSSSSGSSSSSSNNNENKSKIEIEFDQIIDNNLNEDNNVLFKKVRHSSALLHLPNNNNNNREIVRRHSASDLKNFNIKYNNNNNFINDDKIREAKENEDEIVARSRRSRLTKEEKVNQLVSLLQNPTSLIDTFPNNNDNKEDQKENSNNNNNNKEEISEEEQKLRRQYKELYGEIEWLSQINNNILKERQHLIETFASNTQQQIIQQEELTKELESLKGIFFNKRRDAIKLRKCIYQFRSILLAQGVECNSKEEEIEEEEEEENNNNNNNINKILSDNCEKEEIEKEIDKQMKEEITEEDITHELSHNPNIAAEIQVMQDCMQRERETLEDYFIQRDKLLKRYEKLKRVQFAIEEESKSLQLSEVALAEVAPAGSYTVLQNNNNNINMMNSDGRAGDISVIMREGFTWPAELIGLTEEEQITVNNYVRLSQKYEMKWEKWQQEHNNNNNNNNNNNTLASEIEKLRRALTRGDAAVNELQKKTDKFKEFVINYGPIAETISEQVEMSKKLLKRQEEKCNEARAEYEALVARNNINNNNSFVD